MAGRIDPLYIPKVAGVVGWDGTNFHALKCNTAGNLRIDALLGSGDQLFSYQESLLHLTKTTVTGANGHADTTAVPVGEIWHVTHVCGVDWTKATTAHVYRLTRGGETYVFHDITQAFAIGARHTLQCDLYMDPGDVLQVWFTGANNADVAWIYAFGSIMSTA